MSNIINNLTSKTINLNDILLDPNNPRFIDVALNKINVREERCADETVQAKALLNMLRFDVDPLKETILSLGFLPIDKIVVRKWKNSTDENTKYVVIEGNRRVAALKKIMQESNDGIWTLTPNQRDNFNNIEVYVLSDENELYFSLIPGLRHVSGIKQWGVYQQSNLIASLRDEHSYTPSDAANSLGISTRECNRLYRAFKALKQAQALEDFEDEINEKKFSYFEEALKNSQVKNWLEWDDTKNSFININNLELFVTWMIGSEDDTTGEREAPRLSEAKSVRFLNRIVKTESFEVFKNDTSKDIEVLFAEESIRLKNINWEQAVKDVTETIINLPMTVVEKIDNNQKSSLTKLIEAINKVISGNEKLNG